MSKRIQRWSIAALTAASILLPIALATPADAAISAAPQGTAIGYTTEGSVGRVTVNDKAVLVIRSQGASALARKVALKLNELHAARQLRPDRIVPAVSGGQYEVRVGKETLLTITPALAKAEQAPPALVAMRMINQLRQAFGGVPFETQASRGLMAGGRALTGYATWYGGEFNGRFTTSGERYDIRLMTAAHRTLPFGTLVLVTHPGNGRSVLVKINDRGPWTSPDRILDLSPAAYRLLAPLNSGVIPIRVDIVSLPNR